MAMKESSKSIRIYFVVIGVLGLISAGASYEKAAKLGPIVLGLVLASLVLNAAYVGIGLAFDALLKSFPQAIFAVLSIALLLAVTQLVLLLMAGSSRVFSPVIRIAIAIYLINVIRKMSPQG